MLVNAETGFVHGFDIYKEGSSVPVDIFVGHVIVADCSVILPVHSRDMLIGLSTPLGRPMLASHLSDRIETLKKPVNVNKVYADLQERFEGTPLDGHLVSLRPETGGRSTWYGMVDEVSDEALLAFANEGERIVRDSKTKKGKSLDRRLAPFVSLRESIDNPELADEIEASHHLGIAFVTAGILTLGTVATIALMKRAK